MKYRVLSAYQKNGREHKPMEDFFIADAGNGIFIVADGVTQNAEEYVPGMKKSEAGMVAEIVAQTVHKSLLNAADPIKALHDGVQTAILRAAEFNQTAKAAYPPATCLVASCIKDGVLYYAYVGDSLAFLLRGSARIQLAEQQTNALGTYRRLSGEKMLKRYLYDNITNNIKSPLGYGVILGDMRAMDFLRIASLPLEPGDRVIVSTDGLDDYLLFTPVDEVKALPPQDMILRSAGYDEPPYAAYADDKSIITIDVTE